MWRLRRFLLRLYNFLRPERAERELTREVASHLSLLEDDYQRRGMTPEQARLAARRAFDGVERAKERSRDERSFLWLEDARRDVRHAARTLARAPGFTAVAVLTLALGIGATTAIFSVINGVLLRPLPYPDPERIVRVGEVVREGRGSGTLSNRSLPLWRETESFEQVAGYSPRSYTWLGPGGPQKLSGAVISPAMLPLLRIAPHLGRLFTTAEEAPGADRVALLSYQSWVNRFAENSDVVGAPVGLDGEPYTIVGVLPEGFYFPDPEVEVWTPLSLPPYDTGSMQVLIAFTALARLRDGVTIEQARTEGRTIVQRLDADRPRRASGATSPARDVQVISLHEEMVRDLRPALLVLSAAVVGVLLIAITNLAGLLLARGTTRQRELAVRGALGAGRGRLVRQLLTESVALSVCGGAIGLLAVFWILGILPAVAPRDVPRLDEVRVDATILVFNLGLSIVVGLVFGSAPALQWSRVNLVRTLNEGSAQTAGGFGVLRANKARAALVVLQVALALVLLIGAGLLLRSFVELVRVDPGYDPANVITAQVDLPQPIRFDLADLARITEPPTLEEMDGRRDAAARFADQLLAQIDTLPGVRAAGFASFLPFVPGSARGTIRWDGGPEPRNASERVMATVQVASPGYLHAMGLRLRSGRFLTERDTAGSPHVVVVNEALAREVFLGAEPIGQRLRYGSGTWEIIGVIRDVKYAGLDAAASEPELYLIVLAARERHDARVIAQAGSAR